MDVQFPDSFDFREGFAPEFFPRSRLFCRPANTFLLLLGELSRLYESQLYSRQAGQDQYRRIALPGPRHGASSIVVSDSIPCAYAVLPSRVEQSSEYDVGRALHRIHLPSGLVEELPGSSLQNISVCEVLSFSDSTSRLYLAVDVFSVGSSGAAFQETHLATFDPSTGETVLLEPMGPWGH